jgi:hypothetical protein
MGVNLIRSEGRTLGSCIHIIWPVVITLDISRETNARLELALEDIAFVEEQHKVDLGQQLVLAKSLPQ